MSEPKLTVLNFSGGRGSSMLMQMLLRGDLPMPSGSFAVLNADPGMENTGTYEYVKYIKAECESRGIYFETVPGPNLYRDLVGFSSTSRTRIDNPPYWTKDPDTGKEGALKQGCTKFYKIAPMDRAIRRLLHRWHGVSMLTRRIPERTVRKWIGFSSDEVMRIKPSMTKYVYFEYPLIDLGITKPMIAEYFEKHGLLLPPRSVCNACFANGLETLKEMYENRPDDWEQACRVDDAIRNMKQLGVDREVYVSKTLIPLRDLPKTGWGGPDLDPEYSCNSGYCFT